MENNFKPVGKNGTGKAWLPCNIYSSAKLGEDVSIGVFSEIGENVEIGDRTRVGAMSFIPEGVKIGADVFIGPRFTGTNDRYPPSDKSEWKETNIGDGASIGAAVTVLPGVSIGEVSLVGAGSVVVCDIPAGETWAGIPARKIEHKEDHHG